jgi:hypothetical protein
MVLTTREEQRSFRMGREKEREGERKPEDPVRLESDNDDAG